ncbi:MAG: DUF3488 and transglutaminase-like domain-containing protein [Bryobacterales bacterium]|nr:DUF3488 and transglutaminase-like domain-containing protein [Bryobacteraceae bacterium]MDW8353237.1 DUF3488 and transglutaminase-like domain-containing protein [Bryobacterales bacterium]
MSSQPVEGIPHRFFQLSTVALAATGFVALAGSGQFRLPETVIVGSALLLAFLRSLGWIRFQLPTAIATGAAAAVFAWAAWERFLGAGEPALPLTRLVAFLAAVQLLAASGARDYVFVKILALLQLFLAAVVSASFNFFAYLAVFVFFSVASLAGGEIYRCSRQGWLVAHGGLSRLVLHLSAFSLVASLAILALTVCFFLVLPRTAGAAFRRLVNERAVLAGFSEDVRLGQIGEILQRSTPVMRIRVHEGRLPDPLRLRGAALVRFDGWRWFTPPAAGGFVPFQSGRAVLATDEQRRRAGPRVLYEVHSLPTLAGVLFVAGAPEVLWMDAPGLWRTPVGTLRVAPRLSSTLRYAVHSFLGEPGPAAAASPDHLQLPRLDPRIERLARDITRGVDTDEAKARALETYLRTRYQYALELPEQKSGDPLADFLFRRRKGHCEYFASAMAVMLRTLGIPSRVVTGFYSAAYNPGSEWHIVRSSDAHSWVEAWIPERGWVTFDPTPAAPSRRASALWARLSFYLDAAEMFWQEWVVGYDRDRQLLLAALMGNSGRSLGSRWLEPVAVRLAVWRANAREWTGRYGLATIALLAIAGLTFWAAPRIRRRWKAWRQVERARRGQADASDATLLYGRLLEILDRRGFRRPGWLTPREFAATLPSGAIRRVVDEFTALYYALRFGARQDVAPRLAALLEELDGTLGSR